MIWGLDMGCLMLQFDDVLLFSSKECDKKNDTETTVIRDRSSWEIENCTVVFWGSIIGQEIFAQNCGFIVGKGVKIMISEG